MVDLIPQRIRRAFIGGTVALVLVHVIGTFGYRTVSPGSSLIDCLYMTFITVTTIGYGETVDLAGSPAGRVFTMFIALSGIGAMTFLLSTMTAFLVEGEMNIALRRRRMEKTVARLQGHYIVCGIGRVGNNVAEELRNTARPYVVVDEDMHQIEQHLERCPEAMYVLGDGSDDDVLKKAGIAHSLGVFAVTGEDAKNLVISLTAKQLNAQARVVARVHEVKNIEKTRKAGADAIVSPDFTGGLRIASAMVRPQVVSFLDEMLKSDDKLRVEEVSVGADFEPCRLGDLELSKRDYILLALREEERWIFNPDEDHVVQPRTVLVFMATPAGRHHLEKLFRDG